MTDDIQKKVYKSLVRLVERFVDEYVHESIENLVCESVENFVEDYVWEAVKIPIDIYQNNRESVIKRVGDSAKISVNN